MNPPMTDDLVGRLKASVTYEYMPMKVRRQLSEAAARIEALEAAITQALSCTPHINVKRGNVGQPVSEIIYDCGDPWEILRTALTPEAPHAD